MINRPGTFTPRSAHAPARTAARAATLYATGMTMAQVGAKLGVSGSTIGKALHAAKAPLRPGSSGAARRARSRRER